MRKTTTKTPVAKDHATDNAFAADAELLSSCLPRSPFRCPDWRWQLSLIAGRGKRQAIAGLDDEWVKRLMAYDKACEEMGLGLADYPAARIDPSIQGAIKSAFSPNRQVVAELEAWVLTGEPLEIIAASCDLPVDVIEAYEKLFFDVRERLDMGDYIRCVVLGTDAIQNLKVEDHASIWKVFAYFRGRYVLEAMLQAFPGRRQRPWPESLPTDPAERARVLNSCKLVVLASCLDTNGMKPADLAKVIELSKTVRRRVEERKAFDSVSSGVTARLDPMVILADSHDLAMSDTGHNAPEDELAHPTSGQPETGSRDLIQQSGQKQTA